MRATVTASGQNQNGINSIIIFQTEYAENPIHMNDGGEDILRSVSPPERYTSEWVVLMGEVLGAHENIRKPDDGNCLLLTNVTVISIRTEDGQELIQRPRGWRR